jgi:hypothetical protein
VRRIDQQTVIVHAVVGKNGTRPGTEIVLVIFRWTTSDASSWFASMCEIHSVCVVGSRLV